MMVSIRLFFAIAAALAAAVGMGEGPQLLNIKQETLSKAGTTLKQILIKQQETERAKISAVAPGLPYTRILDGKVLIDITTFGNAKSVLGDLKALGLTNGAFFYKQISGFMPLNKIAAVLEHPGVRFATASQFKTRAGTPTQVDISMQTDLARVSFGVDGTGVSVATMSDSFNSLNGYAADIASGDLPADVTIVEDTMGTDEGRAMVQIVHDIAPGASLFFRTAGLGEADFAQGIKDLAYSGVDIINDDILYFTEPMFQDGIVAQAATYAVSIGTHYFSAAGNNDELSYESLFRDGGAPPVPVSGPSLLGLAHDFDPGPGVDVQQQFKLEPGDNLTLTFQWPQPFVSACDGDCPGPNTDFALGLFDPATMTYVVIADDDNLASGAPLEIITYVNEGMVDIFLDLVIVKKIGPIPALIKYVEVSGISPTQFNVQSATSFGHANADKVIAVGSAAWFNVPPESGIPFVNDDSSTAGIPIYLDTKNNFLSEPLVRKNPDVTGPDGGNTSFFGDDISEDPDTFPNFFGTSAATPAVAGLAALIEQQNGPIALSPLQLETILETTALDIPSPSVGFDFKSGFGLVQANGQDGAVCADVDNDGFCLNDDACVDDPQKTKAGRCGCGTPEGSCKPRSRSGGGSFVPSSGVLSGLGSDFPRVTDVNGLIGIPVEQALPPMPLKAGEEQKSALDRAPASLEPIQDELITPSASKNPSETPSSCTSVNGSSKTAIFGLLLLFFMRCFFAKRFRKV